MCYNYGMVGDESAIKYMRYCYLVKLEQNRIATKER